MDRPADRGAAVGAEASLTKNVSCKEFDVIRYQFTVTMPTRHLEVLMRNLYTKAFHKILRVEMRRPTAEETGGCYYGTEPVMRVTIYGEQLLLTDWTRGRWVRGAKGKKAHWSAEFPPLMPAAVLRTLPAKALRKEDEKRIKSKKQSQRRSGFMNS